MVAPIENRPQLGEPNPGSFCGSDGSVFGDTLLPTSRSGALAFLREPDDPDWGTLLGPDDLFVHRLARREGGAPGIERVAVPKLANDAATEAELLADLLGNIRQSNAADSSQTVTETEVGNTRSSVVPVAVTPDVSKESVSEAVTAAPPNRGGTGYSFSQRELAHPRDPVVPQTVAANATLEPKDSEPEVLTATEVRTDPNEAYEAAGKQTRERVKAISFSGRVLIKNLLNRMSGTAVTYNKSDPSGHNSAEQGRKPSRNQLVALGVTTALGLVAASGILPGRDDGERTLFGKSPNTTVEIEVTAGAWSEQIPTVMRWEQDVIRLIKEYNVKAIETNRINAREKRPGVVPYGAVDSGLILSLMAVASGGNPFATDKNADPNQPDKIPAGLMMISREAGRKVITDFEPTNPIHSIAAGIAFAEALISRVPLVDAPDRPSLVAAALLGKQAGQPDTPYPVSPNLLAELVTWVPALDSAWLEPKNPHIDKLLKDPNASARLQLAVNEAKDNKPLAGSTAATQPNKN